MEKSQTASACDIMTQPVGGHSTTSEVHQFVWSESGLPAHPQVSLHAWTLHPQAHRDELRLWTENTEFHAPDLRNLGFFLHMRKKVSISYYFDVFNSLDLYNCIVFNYSLYLFHLYFCIFCPLSAVLHVMKCCNFWISSDFRVLVNAVNGKQIKELVQLNNATGLYPK